MKIMLMTGTSLSEKIAPKEKYNKFITIPKMHSKRALVSNSSHFWSYWRKLMARHAQDKPGIEHQAISHISSLCEDFTEITHDIRGLTKKAGVDSGKLIEIHGSIHDFYCMKCNEKYKKPYIDSREYEPICNNYRNNCGGIIRPGVTLIGEPALKSSIRKALLLLDNIDLLIIAGTNIEYDYQMFLIQEAISKRKPILFVGERASPFSGRLLDLDISIDAIGSIELLQVDFHKAQKSIISMIKSVIESGNTSRDGVLDGIHKMRKELYSNLG